MLQELIKQFQVGLYSYAGESLGFFSQIDVLNIRISNLTQKIDDLTAQIYGKNMALGDCEKEVKALKNEKNPSTPVITGELSIYDIKDLLTVQTKVRQLIITDMYYKTPSVQSVKNALKLDLTNTETYMPIWYDCDDFSFRLHGFFSIGEWAATTMGIAHSKLHAFNFFITSDKKVYIIEPQTDVVRLLEDVKTNKMYYPFEVVMV